MLKKVEALINENYELQVPIFIIFIKIKEIIKNL